MNIIALVGTNADRSTNRKLLQYMARHFAQVANIEVCEIKDLPAFNEPASKVAPVAIQILSDKIEAADAVIIATPEYDHSIPAALKSVIEWLSYTTRPLIHKPVMIVGASHGSLGTSRAQGHLRQILDAPELKARVMPGSEFLLGRSLAAFDEEGNLVYADKVAELEECFAEFVQFAQIMNEVTKDHLVQVEQNKKFSWEVFADGGMNE